MAENELPSFLSGKVAIYCDTIRKSQLDIQTQGTFQRGGSNPTFYELISFDGKHLPFHSIAILPPGETLLLKKDDSQIKFKSESSSEPGDCNIKVFVRVIDERGSKFYRQLSIINVEKQWLVFVYNSQPEDSGDCRIPRILVDSILIVGSFGTISYVIFRDNATLGCGYNCKWNRHRCDAFYYGEQILDMASGHSTVVDKLVKSPVKECSHETLSKISNMSDIFMLIESSKWKTLLELENELQRASIERSNKIEDLEHMLQGLCSGEKSSEYLDGALDSLMCYFVYPLFVFSDKVQRKVLVSLARKCCENIVFGASDSCYKTLKVLVRDSKIAFEVMYTMRLGSDIVSKLTLTDYHHWTERECMMDLLLDLISHWDCMRLFLKSEENTEGGALFDVLVSGVSSISRYSVDNFYAKLKEIGNRIELFRALGQVKSIYNELEDKEMSPEKPFHGHLDRLSESINSAIELIDILYVGALKHGAVVDKKEMNQYTVSYMVEAGFPLIINFFVAILKDQFSDFPMLCLNLHLIIGNLLSFVNKFINIFDFTDTLMKISDVLNFVLNICSRTDCEENNGFRYGRSSLEDFARMVKRDCDEMILYTILIKLFSSMVGKLSCASVIGGIYRLCEECDLTYKALARVLMKHEIVDLTLRLLNCCIDTLRMEMLPLELPSSNDEVRQLLDVLCTAIAKDTTGTLLYTVGQKIIPVIEAYIDMYSNIPVKFRMTYLDPIQKLLQIMKTIFGGKATEDLQNSDGPEKEPKLFENINDFLGSVIKAAGTRIYPNKLKQDIDKVISAKNMGSALKGKFASIFLAQQKNIRSIEYSFIRERFQTMYCPSNGHVDLLDIHWDVTSLDCTKAEHLGVDHSQASYYRDCGLFIVPPDPIPDSIVYGLRLINYLGTCNAYGEMFCNLLLNRECMENLLLLWVHALGCLYPDFDTTINSGMGAFSSIVGYEWFFSGEDALPVITTILKIVYTAMEHLLDDIHSAQDLDECDLGYRNEDLLNLLILTSVHITLLKRWYHTKKCGINAQNCLKWLCKLMSYWFTKFKKSQSYLLNCLMSSYISLPRMADGVALLIIACNPSRAFNVSISIGPLSEENEEMPSGFGILFENQKFIVNFSKSCPPQKESSSESLLWNFLDGIDDINIPVLVDFMCTVASRCCTVQPCTLILTSELSYLMILGGIPLIVFLRVIVNNCMDEFFTVSMSNSDRKKGAFSNVLKLITFFGNLMSLINDGLNFSKVTAFRIAYETLELYSRFTKNSKCLSEVLCWLLFEGYLEVFKCHNKLWVKDPKALVQMQEFHNYLHMISGGVNWICQCLNGCKLKNNSEDQLEEDIGHETTSSVVLSWDAVLVGMAALCCAFEVPFTTLNILYTVLPGPLELIIKMLNNQTESEIIKVTASSALWLHNLIRQMCDSILLNAFENMGIDGGILKSKLYTQMSIFQKLYEICHSIRSTGSCQDCFIFTLVQGAQISDIELMATTSKLSNEPLVAQQSEDIYSDLMLGSKSRILKKIALTKSQPIDSGVNFIFRGICEALETLKHEALSGLKRDETCFLCKSIIANTVLLSGCFDALSKEVAKDAMERGVPRSIPGYLFLGDPPMRSCFRRFITNTWNTVTTGDFLTGGITPKILHLVNWNDWMDVPNFVCMSVPVAKGAADDKKTDWLSRCFTYDGSDESIEMNKTLRTVAKRKLVFQDEIFVPTSQTKATIKKSDKTIPTDLIRYPKSTSSRAPSKHVDDFEYEKAAAAVAAETEGSKKWVPDTISKISQKLASNITTKGWQDFDSDLQANGLSIRSIMTNPSQLKEQNAKSAFINVLSRHQAIKNLLIATGVDVR